MSVFEMLMAAAYSEPKVYATLNSSDKSAIVTLSGGNLTASFAGAGTTNGVVRSTISKSTGKWYYELTVGSLTNALIGIATSSAPLTSYLGSSADGWGYQSSNGHKLNITDAAYGNAYTSGDVIGVALDMTAGTLTFYKNNVTQGVAYTGLTGSLFAALSNGAGTNGTVTANFGATPLTYAPPAGYNAGLYA